MVVQRHPAAAVAAMIALRGGAAVDRQCRAGDEGGSIRAEPDDRLRDLCGGAESVHLPPNQAGGQLRRKPILDHRRIDHAGADRVHPYPLPRELLRRRFRQADHAPLARAVGEEPLAAAQPGD
jgi:hypothetical protein